MKRCSRTYVTVDLNAVAYNFESMRKNIAEGTKMIAVVKADAYGHGAVPIACMIHDYSYIWGFATATVDEAIELRENGITKPILILGFVFEDYYEDLVIQGIRTAVFTLDMAKKLSDTAVRLNKIFPIHLAVDTGMTRIGFSDTEASVELVKEIAQLPNLEIEGMFTHFARADEGDKTGADRQLERYLSFVEMLKEAGVQISIRHCSNSAGIIDMPYANLDVVRAGISIYGIYPSDEVKSERVPLKPVMSWSTFVSYVKTVPAGVEVSYGGTYVTEKETRIATIPVGYADGYPRQLSSRGWVLIHGKKAHILGRVCMDQFMVDVSEIEDVKSGDEVILLGNSGDETITVETLAALSGRFPYEFICDVSKRVPRVYRKDGKQSNRRADRGFEL